MELVKTSDIGGGGVPWKLPGPDYVTYVFVFLGSIIICRLYKLTIQTKPKSLCN